MTDKELQPNPPSPHEQLALPNIMPEEELERIHELIGLFAEKYELPDRVADALRPETALHFTIGLPRVDREFVKSYVSFVRSALTVFDEDFEKIKHGKFEPIDLEDDDVDGRLRRNIIIPPSRDDQTFNWENTLLASKSASLYQSGLICSMVESMRISHFHIYKHHSKFSETELRFHGDDFELLTGESGSGKVKESIVAQRLRELGLVDATKAKLDARWELFDAVLQFELIRLITHDLRDFGRIAPYAEGRPASHYETVQSLLQMQFHFDDLESKILFLRKLLRTFYVAQREATSEAQVAYGLLITERTARLKGDLEDQFIAMNRVFEEEGFPAPEALTAVTPEAFLEERARRERKKVKELQEERQRIELRETKEGLVSRHASLLQQVEAANKPWLLSAKGRRTQGLAELNKALLQGFETATQEHIEIDIPTDEVPIMTGVLAALHHMLEKSIEETGSISSAQGELEVALKLYRILESSREELYKDIREASLINLEYPQLLKLPDYIQQLHHQWPAFEKLLIEKWPINGRQVASQIKALLDAHNAQTGKEGDE